MEFQKYFYENISMIFECVQYVSALRPPKLTHHAVNSGRLGVNSKISEAAVSVEGRRRVCSLTYNGSTPVFRHNLQRWSLHSHPMNSQLNWSLEEELKRRRRLAWFDQPCGEMTKSDSDSESGEISETDEHEWKQVSGRKEDLFVSSVVVWCWWCAVI